MKGLSSQEKNEQPALWVTGLNFSPLRKEGKLESGEEKRGTVHQVHRGSRWEGRLRIAPLGVQESLQLLRNPVAELPGLLGQVGPLVVLGGADAHGNRKGSFLPMRHPFPNEFCISLDEDTWTGLKIAPAEPPTFIISTFTP